jgi:hypothetical protein
MKLILIYYHLFLIETNLSLLIIGGTFIACFIYTLGAIFEAIENGTHFYFEKLEGFKKLHLINITGSPLSG